jgi:hypothetical protein
MRIPQHAADFDALFALARAAPNKGGAAMDCS